MNSVLCLSWVRKAAAKEVPDRVQLNSEDLKLLLSHDHGATKEFLDEETDTAKPGISIPVYINIYQLEYICSKCIHYMYVVFIFCCNNNATIFGI